MWKTIKDFPNYEISDDGRVKSKQREITDSVGHKYQIRERILKPCSAGKGYPVVWFRKNGQSIRQYVHILVAKAFIPNPENYPVVNHQDGNKLNCKADNLEWTTYSHNNQHAYDTKLKLRGEGFYNSKLTEANVKEIKSQGKYATFQKIADKYGVSKATIRDILVGKTWKDIS